MCVPQRYGPGARLRAPHTLPIALVALLAVAGCGESPTHSPKPGTSGVAVKGSSTYHIDLPTAEARPGTAVVVLVDTSGSMGQTVPDRSGKQRPKSEIAREALEHIVSSTADWKKSHPDRALQLAVYNFSSDVREVLPMGDFDPAKAKAALQKIPAPAGGTAIGRALEEGFKALYRSGRARKFVVCVTDGENTSGPQPDWVARGLFAQTKGEVELQFVAFDTSASQFHFLKEVNGEVVQAANGEQLQAELAKIYEQRILAEKEESPDKK
ncbi:MAG TPA: vWA domain-containing protein [Gemmataceae bacterium]|nr:vWA domain-containing protein [Gemmataceae bacterium]